eukprot:scaffold430883_cov14-Prasinocladus_malaysianus.AAC.1
MLVACGSRKHCLVVVPADAACSCMCSYAACAVYGQPEERSLIGGMPFYTEAGMVALSMC